MEKIPYELLNGRKPNISYFRVFGCKCYILKKCTRLSKFKKKCDECFLLGYSTTSNTYRVCVDRISSAVLRGVSHEGRLIDRDACNREQEDNKDTRVRQVRAVSVI